MTNSPVKKSNLVVFGRKRVIPTQRPQLVGVISANFCRVEACRVVSTAVNLSFLYQKCRLTRIKLLLHFSVTPPNTIPEKLLAIKFF
jgi:hypothetical protein